MDRRRLARIGGTDLQMPTTGRPAWRDAHQEARERVGLGQRAHARRRAFIAQRREIKLNVWPHSIGTIAEEAAGLVDAERQRSAPEGSVAQRRGDFAPPGIEFVVEGWQA